jgi:cytochrome c peroxidase
MSVRTWQRIARSLAILVGSVVVPAGAQVFEPLDPFEIPQSLATFPPPVVLGIETYVRDRAAAIALGKALFWEQQTGGDGQIACANCHFSAGTDARTFNTVYPGFDDTFALPGPNGTVTADMFPFRRLADPRDRLSRVLFDTNDVIGAQGIASTRFLAIRLGSPVDLGTPLVDPEFGTARRVTTRNAPTTINAVYNVHNFWDGRADNVFNGVNPRGAADGGARVFKAAGNVVSKVSVRLKNSALASQSVGPPNNAVEMAFDGRRFPQLGKKLLSLRPLQLQAVDATDSVLGPYRHPSGLGLNGTYGDLIRQAFHPAWWNSPKLLDVTGSKIVGTGTPTRLDQYTVMELNTSLFWGLAIQLYETTLISDETPFDHWREGDATAMTARQIEGLDLFMGIARCDHCHNGPLFTSAIVQFLGLVDRSEDAFTNTAVRPIAEDPGVFFNIRPTPEVSPVKHGLFKTPGLRNVELTGPYFHTGGFGTLKQVVQFYNRGGDFPTAFTDGAVRPLLLTDAQEDAIVDFMLALTDERVRFQLAPFDHPELNVPNGPLLPAVGAAGGAPMAGFLGLDPFAD